MQILHDSEDAFFHLGARQVRRRAPGDLLSRRLQRRLPSPPVQHDDGHAGRKKDIVPAMRRAAERLLRIRQIG